MRITNLFLLVALLLAAIGCGGGGSTGGGGVTPGSGALFMTDSLSSYDHVWITVQKVVLTGASGNTTVFDDPAGKTVDLKTLRDGTGERYAFLSSTPAGVYTGVTVTVAKDLTLFSGGSATGAVREFAGNNGVTANLTLTFSSPRTFGPGNGFALDFSIGDWTDNGTTVTGAPFLKEGQGNGLGNPDRHEREDYHGSIQGLAGTAPNQTFVLSNGVRNVNVITSGQTVVFNSNGTPSPVLANGKRVEVRGLFSVEQTAILADVVKIKEGNGGQGEAEVKGPATNINPELGTMTVTVTRAHHFMPAQSTVEVSTTESTVYFTHGGVSMTRAEFFAAMTSGQPVEAEGSYDAGSNTLTARKIKLEDGPGHHHEAEIKGSVSNLDKVARTFDVNAVQWEGIVLGSNHLIHVVVTPTTRYERDEMTAEQFFNALNNGHFLEVEGSFDSSTMTLTASKMHFED